MRLLVLTSEPISASQLRDALPDDAQAGDTEVVMVAPALQESPLKFWVSDVDDAIARADEVRRQSVDQLGNEGVPASGDTGESDPVKALEDALSTFAADRILLFTHPDEHKRYREDLDLKELRERFGIPVDEATVTT